MKTKGLGFLPEARREGIITKEVERELLVYDRARDEAHCLNETAAAVWKLCDAQTTPVGIAQSLRLDIPAQGTDQASTESCTEDLVWLALAELRRAHLLREPECGDQWPNVILGMSRREAIRHIGLCSAIALPIVVSMTVPTAVQAAVSCKPPCMPCTTGECCSGVCGSAASVGCPGSGNKCA